MSQNTATSAPIDGVIIPSDRVWTKTLSTRERTVRVTGDIPSEMQRPAPFPGEPDDLVELSWDEQADATTPGTFYVRDLHSGLVLLYRGETATVEA